MKATLEIKGEKVPVEITGEELDRVLKMLEKPVKKTGYEWVEDGKEHYISQGENAMCEIYCNSIYDHEAYENGDYYSDKTVAENNARADALMRKLRRFAVEHRETELDWKNCDMDKYYIYYDHDDNHLEIDYTNAYPLFGTPHFDSLKAAQAAIEEFKDELIWFFTEYKDSL